MTSGPKGDTRPTNGRRFALFVALSVAVHALLWLLAPRAPMLPPHGEPPRISVNVVTKPAPKPKQKPIVQPKQRNPIAVKPPPKPPPKVKHEEQITKAYVDQPSPVPKPLSPDAEHKSDTAPQAPNPGHAATEGGTSLGNPNAGGKTNGGTGQVDPGQVKLFDPSALGMAVHRWQSGQPDPHQYMAAHADGDPDDPLAEQARVGGRIAADVEEAQAEGRVEGGLQSSCNDGIDQGQDGLMDCADPGCRMLPACANTAEYSQVEDRRIPDNNVVGVTSQINVPEDGAIRTASIQVNVKHGSPGDLAIEVVHLPDGRRSMIRMADRHNRFFPRAYLLKDFIGTESQGTWEIHVRDVFRGVEGKLVSWHLYITR